MKIKIRYIKDIAVMEPEGKININSSRLIEAVGSIIDGGVCKIIIDMQLVDFVDYNGLSVLAIAYKNTLNHKAHMRLCCISDDIIELLKVVKLDDVFEIYDDVNDAIEAFSQKSKPEKADDLGQKLRRRFTRLDVDIPVNYRLCKGPHRGDLQIFSGRVANISGSGLYMRTIHMFPPGSEVDMEIRFAKNEEPKHLRGIILWVADKDLQPDFFPGIGVSFSGISRQAQEDIIEFVEKNVIRRKE